MSEEKQQAKNKISTWLVSFVIIIVNLINVNGESQPDGGGEEEHEHIGSCISWGLSSMMPSNESRQVSAMSLINLVIVCACPKLGEEIYLLIIMPRSSIKKISH